MAKLPSIKACALKIIELIKFFVVLEVVVLTECDNTMLVHCLCSYSLSTPLHLALAI